MPDHAPCIHAAFVVRVPVLSEQITLANTNIARADDKADVVQTGAKNAGIPLRSFKQSRPPYPAESRWSLLGH